MAKKEEETSGQKRGRGRPRKVENVDDNNSNSNSSNDIDNEFENKNIDNNNNQNIDINSLENDQEKVYVEDSVIDESESLTKRNSSSTDIDKFELPPEDLNFEQDVAIENTSQNLADINDDIPDQDFDPLQVAVKERDYTTGKIESGSSDNVNPEVEAEKAKQLEEKIAEPEIKNPSFDTPPIDEKDKKKNTGGGGGSKNTGGDGGSGGGNNNGGGGGNDKEFEGFETGDNVDKKKEKETANPKLDDLTPAQKRKAAEKAADAILLTYQKFVPKPFKHLSSFNMRKLQIMEMKNELALDIQVFDDGTTVKKYCENVNKQVEETFVITDEMKQEAKEPLVDLLLENNLALTPAQRLLLVVGGHVVQMGVTAIQFMNQNKHALSEFKRFHQESMEAHRATMHEAENRFKNDNNNNNNNNNGGGGNNNNGSDTQTTGDTNPKNTPPKNNPPKNEKKVVEETENDDIPPDSDADEDVPNFKEETTSDTNENKESDNESEKDDSDKIIHEEKINVKGSPNIDEYLTEENGGITVEVEENKDDIDEDF